MSLVFTSQCEGNDLRFHRLLGMMFGEKRSQQSLIDLCAHDARHWRILPFADMTFVDVVDNSNVAPESGKYVVTDVLGDHECFNRHYDVATCLDGIEHLHKEPALRLRDRMANLGDSAVIFTPDGPFCVDPNSNDPYSHKWVATLDDFPGFCFFHFPKWHPTLNIGAFFAWKTIALESEFSRVVSEIHSVGGFEP